MITSCGNKWIVTYALTHVFSSWLFLVAISETWLAHWLVAFLHDYFLWQVNHDSLTDSWLFFMISSGWWFSVYSLTDLWLFFLISSSWWLLFFYSLTDSRLFFMISSSWWFSVYSLTDSWLFFMISSSWQFSFYFSDAGARVGQQLGLQTVARTMPRLKRTHLLIVGVIVFLSWNILTFYSLTSRNADVVSTAYCWISFYLPSLLDCPSPAEAQMWCVWLTAGSLSLCLPSPSDCPSPADVVCTYCLLLDLCWISFSLSPVPIWLFFTSRSADVAYCWISFSLSPVPVCPSPAEVQMWYVCTVYCWISFSLSPFPIWLSFTSRCGMYTVYCWISAGSLSLCLLSPSDCPSPAEVQMWLTAYCWISFSLSPVPVWLSFTSRSADVVRMYCLLLDLFLSVSLPHLIVQIPKLIIRSICKVQNLVHRGYSKLGHTGTHTRMHTHAHTHTHTCTHTHTHTHARVHTHTHTQAPAHLSILTIQSLIYTTWNWQQTETSGGWRTQKNLKQKWLLAF